MDLKLRDKLCLVTGSTGGIGLSIAKLLAELGATVIINGRSEESTNAAIQAVNEVAGRGNGGQVEAVVGDLSTAEGCKAFIEKVRNIEQTMGRPVDVLINNLGMFHNQDFAEVTDEKWSEYYETNTMSGVRLCRHFLPIMLQRNDFGRIIFVSSEAALKPLPNMLAYSVSKTSQLTLSRGLAELTKGSQNITVNAVMPGPTLTQGVQDYLEGWARDHGYGDNVEEATAQYFKQFEPTSLLQRFLDPDEVAYAVVMLCSPRASGINGTAQHVDGGIVRHIA